MFSNIIHLTANIKLKEALLNRITILESDKIKLMESISKEQITNPVYTQEHFLLALKRIRDIDYSSFERKRKLIDTFVNAVYMYDDEIKIVYNANNKEENATLEELFGSNLDTSGSPSI